MGDDESVNDHSVESISTEMSGQAMEEEATYRYQLEIEEAVSKYQNEPRIRHNVYPDSDSDSENEAVPIVNVKRSHQIQRRRSGALFVGKAYPSGVAFKENVLDFALSTGYNIKQKRWDQMKLEYKCGSGKCPWKVYCSVNKRKNRWELKIEGNCCEDVENNSVESFNNTIVGPRERPVMPMLEMIRRLAMVRIHTRFGIAKKHQGMCTPYVKEMLDETLDDAKLSKVYPGSTEIYEVEIGSQYESVDMRERECTCCKWQITGIPCVHAYGVILKTKDDPNKYVADWFHTSRWRDTYEHAPKPVRGPDSWSRGDIALVSEDPERKKMNKKKEKRKRSVGESPTKKKKKKKKSYMEKDNVVESQDPDKPRRHMHCKHCGGQGHNKRTCSKSKKDHGGECSTQPLYQVDDA